LINLNAYKKVLTNKGILKFLIRHTKKIKAIYLKGVLRKYKVPIKRK